MTPSGLCECGCGQETDIVYKTQSSRGIVAGEHRRFVHGHNTRKSPVEYIEEDRGYDTPCWIWQLTTATGGYGRKFNGEKQIGAHRIYYERAKGPIPEGLHLDHLCRVPACVNPDHLEPVTCAENTLRGAGAKLTRVDRRDIQAVRGVLPQTTIAEVFGVAQSHISLIQLAKYAPDPGIARGSEGPAPSRPLQGPEDPAPSAADTPRSNRGSR
jgi:hypothetical protein